METHPAHPESSTHLSRDVPPLFTVAICTRNRADHLKRCLSGLEQQASTVATVPIIIVDNASTDSTPSVINEFGNIRDIRYLYEPTLGLSHARNAALKNTTTEYLVFLDDDAIPMPGWIEAITAGIDRWNPDIFGGPYIPHYLHPKPTWFKDKFGSAHTGMVEGLAAPFYCFSGGNMGWRVSLLKTFGGFDPRLGMVGDKLGLGEETAIQMALWQDSPALRRAMLPAMLMTHYVPPEKMRLSYIWKRCFTYGRQLGQISPENPTWANASFTRTLLRCKFGLPLLLRMARDSYLCRENWKSYAVDWMSRFAIQFGAAWERKAL